MECKVKLDELIDELGDELQNKGWWGLRWGLGMEWRMELGLGVTRELLGIENIIKQEVLDIISEL